MEWNLSIIGRILSYEHSLLHILVYVRGQLVLLQHNITMDFVQAMSVSWLDTIVTQTNYTG
jgi:hypothetical protein